VPDKSDKLPKELAWLTRAHVELAKATTVGEFKSICDRAQAAQVYLAHVGFSLSVQFVAAEIWLLAVRGAGLAIRRLHLRRGRPAKKKKRLQPATFLADLKIHKTLSHRWQRIARIPAVAFEGYLSKCRERNSLPTMQGLFDVEKSLRPASAARESSGRKPPHEPAARHDLDGRKIGGDKTLGESSDTVLSWDDALKHRGKLRELLAELSGEKPLAQTDSALLRYTVQLCSELDEFVHQLPHERGRAKRESSTAGMPARVTRRKKS
jgi:hypothetical protein